MHTGLLGDVHRLEVGCGLVPLVHLVATIAFISGGWGSFQGSVGGVAARPSNYGTDRPLLQCVSALEELPSSVQSPLE